MKIYIRANDDIESYREKKVYEFMDAVKNGRKTPYWIADMYFELQDLFRRFYGVVFDVDGKIYSNLPENIKDAIAKYWEDEISDDYDSDGDGWFNYMEP